MSWIYLKHNDTIYSAFDTSKISFKDFIEEMKEKLEAMDEKFDYAVFFNNRYLEFRHNVYDHEMRVGNYTTHSAAILDEECSDEELILAAADTMNEMFLNPNEEASRLKEYRFVFSDHVDTIGHSTGRTSFLKKMEEPSLGLFTGDDLEVVRELLTDQENQLKKLKKRLHALEEEAKNKAEEE